jgi:uncharacterized membrane protein YkgB
MENLILFIQTYSIEIIIIFIAIGIIKFVVSFIVRMVMLIIIVASFLFVFQNYKTNPNFVKETKKKINNTKNTIYQKIKGK